MELELKNFNDSKIKSTGGKTTKMRMSDDASSMVFQMFTKNVYSNPIGTVVREIASNCFDSHIEAGTDSATNPVLIKHTTDKLANQHYISFFDYGVGMSPDRIENVYGVYFESTKRKGNDQIGGFGIGGKTPLAYTDTFFVITRFNGIEYSYTIYKGNETPEIQLLNEKSTKERNGTEIRIPIGINDLDRFEKEIKRQLFYFENIVYQGFDSDEQLNDYKLYKGKTFLYRGSTYSDSIHVCLGKVAYPIDYSAIGLSQYDYSIPIAIKMNIGEVGVTVSRESLDYSPETIKTLQDKIEVVMNELKTMLSKQYDNVQTIEDYYYAKDNFGHLKITDNVSLAIKNHIQRKDISYDNFKYNDIPSFPASDLIFKHFYNVHEYGKPRRRNSWASHRTNVVFGEHIDRVYHCKGEFQRKLVKQAYLNNIHDKNFVILKPYILTDLRYRTIGTAFGMYSNAEGKWEMGEKKAINLIDKLFADVKNWVETNYESYDDLDVPQGFIDARKKERLSDEVLKTTIPVKFPTNYDMRDRISLKTLSVFKGKIYYGDTDEVDDVRYMGKMFRDLFGSDNMVYNYSDINCLSEFKENYSNKSKHMSIMFISVSKANLKYIKMLSNSMHISLAYPTMLHRKVGNPENTKIALTYINKTNNILPLFGNPTFNVINQDIADAYANVKKEVKKLKEYEVYENLNFSHRYIKKYFKDQNADLKIETEKDLEYLITANEVNESILKWIKLPYWEKDADLSKEENVGLVDLLKKVLVL